MRKRRIMTVALVLTALTMLLSSCENRDKGISNSRQLISFLNSLHYQSPERPGNLPVTEDIQIIGTVVLFSHQLAVPDECSPMECRQLAGFQDDYGAEGIRIVPLPLDEYHIYPPSMLILSNIKLRFLPLLNLTLEHHAMAPVIHIMPPSDYECSSSQTKCAGDNICYDNSGYCLHCLSLTQEKCACRDEKGVFPDGTACEVIGGDVVAPGTCHNGICEISY